MGPVANDSATADPALDTAVAVPRPRGHAGSLPYLPALDGLRGLAIVGVLLFHGGMAAFGGGFLGVSTFFTLSGFLITALLLREHAATGTIDRRGFWGRRFRRLLPAALLTIAVATALVWRLGDASQLNSFRGDGLGAVGYVANWRFILAGQSYGAVFGAPSPLLHFWSLAIEEQFYLVFPLVAFGVLRLAHGSRRIFGGIIGALFATSALLPSLMHWSNDRVYFGTDTRAAELLAGSLLAVVLTSSRQPLDRLGDSFARRSRNLLAGAGVAALALIVALWVLTSQQTRWVYTGGLALYGLLTAFVIFSAVLRGSPVSRMLSWRPLRGLGKISYGVYLYHWPLLWWLTTTRTGLDPMPRLTLVAALSIGVATVSYRFVEQPIRRGAWPLVHRRTTRRPHPAFGAAGAMVVAAMIVVVTVSVPMPAVDLSNAAAGTLITTGATLPAVNSAADLAAPRPLGGAGPSTTAAPVASATPVPLVPKPVHVPSRPLRVLVVGDSTAAFLNVSLNIWGLDHKIWGSYGQARIGCGIGRGGERVNHATAEPIPSDCGDWATEWPAKLKEVQPDLVIVSSGLWDATDRQLPGDPTWRHPGDPVYDGYLRKEFSTAVDILGSTGAVVAWIDNPPIKLGVTELNHNTDFSVNDPARMTRLNEILGDVASTHPAMRIIPFTAFLQGWPGGVFDQTLRPDDLHVDVPGGAKVAEWMGPEILDAYWTTRAGGPT